MRLARFLSVLAALSFALCGCSTAPQVIVDPRSIKSEEDYRRDMDECHRLAMSYDKSDATTGNAAVGAAAGGITVAGIATAVAGAVFAPAIPFIAAGAAAGGTLGGGLSKGGETASREKIMAECLGDRGFRAYSPR